MPNHDLHAIRSFDDLLMYLEEQLDWPLQGYTLDEAAFTYEPDELGLKDADATRIRAIRQLRPLTQGQPWGIFFVEFEHKKLPVVALRRILSHLVVKKRAIASQAMAPAWHAEDLLFVTAFGDTHHDGGELAFAHFHQNPGDLPTLHVLGWDGGDTPLKLADLDQKLRRNLRWPDDPTDVAAWREHWRQPFRHKLGHIIRTADLLASELARLARNIREVAGRLLDAETDKGPLTQLYRAFQTALIHDLTPATFADTYAQTITYGLLTAAISRTEMSEGRHGTALIADNLTDMVPITNPFLRETLQTFLKVGGRKGGINFDELGIQDIVELLRGDETDLPAILRDFGNKTRGEDPVIHFYEHFLNAYNKKLKVQRGVFYTPQPVVSYIVRSVHELLQTEFGLEDGLADTATWGDMLRRFPPGEGRGEGEPGLKLPMLRDDVGNEYPLSADEPFIQILDPATGTATFLVEVIEVIHRTLTEKWTRQGLSESQRQDAWNAYVPRHLLPRLHGYELMMAPYAIAHMKIGLKLAETGYRFGSEERARIYLTNALEPWVQQLPLIGFDALAHEAAAVNEIKRHKRFTVVIGNPPYSNFGMLNKNPFILGMLEDYKRGLDERKINLDDDFIKFVRFSQRLLDVNGVGVFGMITNNVFVDGITHRRMRESLKASFGDVRILDLHGSSKKLEETPDGKKDENVFDIQQGVGISLFVSTGSKRAGSVSHSELWGERASKYSALARSVATSSKWQNVESAPPHHFFVPKNFDLAREYQSAPALTAVFPEQNAGIQTKNDGFVYAMSRAAIEERIADLKSEQADRIAQKYELSLDGHWDIYAAKEDIRRNKGVFVQVLNKPFDKRWTYYTAKTSGFMARPRAPIMRAGLIPNKILLTVRNPRRGNTDSFFVANTIADKDGVSPFDNATIFPLFLPHPDDGQATLLANNQLNLGQSFLASLRGKLGTRAGEHGLPAGLTPEDIFHYAYAVFHSPGYRSRYAEFLKIDFPRLPLTGSLELFRALAALGGELVALHLLESPKVDDFITTFHGSSREVAKVGWTPHEGGTVWIDAGGTKKDTRAGTSGFQGVPENVWNFHIGGYQVCEKWLKDRKGRTLSDEDLTHYQRVVVALHETIRLMAEIDSVIDQHGGWPGAFQSTPVAAAS